MFIEIGRIVGIESESLWVESIQRSACGSCQAQKGCGHSMLAKWGVTASRLRVLLDGRDPSSFKLGDAVQIGVPEEVIAKGSLFVYLVPLLMMLATTFIAHQQGFGDGLSALSALAGLLLGALIVRWRSYQIRFDNGLHPILIDEQTSAQTIQICTLE
jgi:sigma-E factor negative regulatory protein RseC